MRECGIWVLSSRLRQLLIPSVPLVVQGYSMGGVPLMLVGLGKGAAGAMLRPGIGMLEASSKTAHGFALACLGKEGIVGSVQRRVRQPGLSAHLLEDSLLEVRNKLIIEQRVQVEIYSHMKSTRCKLPRDVLACSARSPGLCITGWKETCWGAQPNSMS